jgi:hypothetical protein
MRVVIERFRTQADCDKQINGILWVFDEEDEIVFHCFTLELPDKRNERKISHVPSGEYNVKKRNSSKYGDHFHILDVPNRDLILIHQANYFFQLEGCVAVGDNLADINKDKVIDVTNSVATMKKLNSILPKSFKLQII